MSKIVLVEDDENISTTIKIAFEAIGNQFYSFGNAEDFLKKSKNISYDLILLDINLPGMNGLDLCQSIRRSNTIVPIIFLTANSEEDMAVKALSIGGQDYVRKPFGLKELIARVNLLINKNNLSSLIVIGKVSINKLTKKIQYDGEEINLSKNEFIILEQLIERPDQIFSRESLLNMISIGLDSSDRAIDTTISRLKQKLNKVRLTEFSINSSYGRGYFLEIKK